MGDDILGVIFLALICIVIAGIINKVAPAGMMIPTFALMAVCLWVAYDYILLQRYKAKQRCSGESNTDNKPDTGSNSNTNESNTTETNNNEPAELNNKDLQDMIDELPNSNNKTRSESSHGDADDNNVARAKHKNEFDIDLYSNQLSVQELHKDMGCAGDNKLANRMKYMMLQPKMSHDARARMNRYTLLQFWEEELRDNENRDWWDAEQDHLDAYM